jgi:predicted nucleic acid-binding protein
LAAWLDQLLRLHAQRLLPVDLATSLEHGLTVVTRNQRPFLPTGVATLNPWST